MKMLRRSGFIVVLFAVLFISTLSAHAALELRGTDSLNNRLIYDTDLNVTWYDFTESGANWSTQMTWASDLSVSGGDLVGVYDDWRLPTALNQNGSGPPCSGYYCTGSEMGHLYYTELGNVACPSSGCGLANKGDFQHLLSGGYWSTEYYAGANYAWFFYNGNGNQYYFNKDFNFYAIAVRPGDVSVSVAPEPVSMILFGVGGVVMGARRMVIRWRG